MPAAPSSLIDPAIGQLLTAAPTLDQEPARLLPALAAIPDPRMRRGIRHRLTMILGLAVCAVLAGARSFTAIAEWGADADQATRDALGVAGVVPSESAFRRTLQALDADALDEAAAAGPSSIPPPSRAAAGGRRGRQDAARVRHVRWPWPASAGRPRSPARRGPGPGRRRGQDERDPAVHHVAGPC